MFNILSKRDLSDIMYSRMHFENICSVIIYIYSYYLCDRGKFRENLNSRYFFFFSFIEVLSEFNFRRIEAIRLLGKRISNSFELIL